MGRRRLVQLSADRLLVPRPCQRPGGTQGVHRYARRRYRDVARFVSAVHPARHLADPGSHAASLRTVANGIHLRSDRGAFAVGRRSRQIGAASAAGLVAGCHGWPYPDSGFLPGGSIVTAGVYLIARTHILFSLAPAAQVAVAIVGAGTLLLAGFSALTQHDIKRVLAYSTISQIGYMFLGLGVGAWQAAIFHFITHAFVTDHLFRGSAVPSNERHQEHTLTRM